MWRWLTKHPPHDRSHLASLEQRWLVPVVDGKVVSVFARFQVRVELTSRCPLRSYRPVARRPDGRNALC